MTSPSLEVQGAIVARLKAFPALSALINNRVYDRVPLPPAFPYVTIGPDQVVSDDAECITGFEMTIQIDAWSIDVGFPNVKRVAEAVRQALHGYDLPLTDNALVSFEHRQTRTFRDPDGITSHATIEFVALVEQP